MRGLNVAKWVSLIIGIILIAGSIFNFANPVETTISVVQLISMMFIVIGVLRIIRYFSNTMFNSGAFLVGGVVDIILGVLILRNIDISVLAFSHLIAFWILFHGIIEIAVALDLRRERLKRWWVALISGIVGIVLGFLMITNTSLSQMYITIMISGYMLLLGITFISTFFAINKFRRLF